MKVSTKTLFYYLLLIVFGVVFYLLNVQTPFLHDDYAYCFYYDSDSYTVRPTDIWVTGGWQLLRSMWHHYLCVNGRFSSHLLLQVFCAFLGKGVFNIANTLIFLLFLHNLVSFAGLRQSAPSLALAFLASLCLLPFPGQTMLWMTGSLNYLWPATFSLIFVRWLMEYTGEPLPFWKHLLLFLACLAVGWSNESITVPVTIGLSFYFLFNRNAFRNGAVSASLGYALGALLIVFGPGTWQRMQDWEGLLNQRTPIQALFIHSFNLASGLIHGILPVIAAAVLLYLQGKHRLRFAAIRKQLPVWLLFGFICFLFALGWDAERVYFGVSVFSLAIVLRAFRPNLVRLDRFRFSCLPLVALCAIPATTALRATASYSAYDDLVYSEVRQAPRQCIVRERPFDLKSRFAYVTTLKPDRHLFHNRVKAFYYGKDFIQALPDDLYDVVTSRTPDVALAPTDIKIDGRALYTFGDYWLLPVDGIPAKRLVAAYHVKTDNTHLKTRQRVIRYLLNTLDSPPEEYPCYGIEIAGETYLVLPRHNEQDLIRIQLKEPQV